MEFVYCYCESVWGISVETKNSEFSKNRSKQKSVDIVLKGDVSEPEVVDSGWSKCSVSCSLFCSWLCMMSLKPDISHLVMAVKTSLTQRMDGGAAPRLRIRDMLIISNWMLQSNKNMELEMSCKGPFNDSIRQKNETNTVQQWPVLSLN